MKRVLLLAVLAVLFLNACGTDIEPEDSSGPPLITIGLSQVGAESDWRVANSESMKAVFTEENGYHLLFDDARQMQENQISAIRKFIQQQVDYIVLMPISETGWDGVLQEAKDAGIPVILVDRMIDTEQEGLYAAHIGSNFLLEGELAVRWMEERYRDAEGPVNIIHIQGTYGSTAQLGRTAALEAAAARNENWNLLDQLDGDFTQAKTYEVMRDYLDGLPPEQTVDVVYCENDNEAFGAVQALEEHGYALGEHGVAVISFDATRNGLRRCMEGKIVLAVECNPLLGQLAAQVIQGIERGELPNQHYYVEEQAFTSDMLTEEFIQGRGY